MLSETTVIYRINRNKLKIAINLLIGVGLLYFCAQKLYGYWIGERDTLWIAVYAFVTAFAIRGLFMQLNVLIKNKPLLAISPLGIYSEVHGHLAKEEITGAELSDVGSLKESLVVYLKNPDVFINNQKGIKKALFYMVNQEKGTPIVIRLRETYNKNELMAAMEQLQTKDEQK